MESRRTGTDAVKSLRKFLQLAPARQWLLVEATVGLPLAWLRVNDRTAPGNTRARFEAVSSYVRAFPPATGR